MKIECILCPTDLSPDSDEALRYAVALSRAYNAELILLHCDQAGETPSKLYANEKAAETIRAALVKYSGSEDLNGLDWRSLVVNCDDTGAAVAREAAKLGVDLIVMRSRRRPHRAALLGSTAESVCRTAPCPVMVMHSDERDWVDGPDNGIQLKRVLVAYDFSDYSELALKYSLSFAQEYQAELHVLHVCRPSHSTNRRSHGIRWAKKAAITKPRGACSKQCRLKRICGATSSTLSARAIPIAKY